MNDRPRVLHIVPARFGEGGIFGGAERYAYELARHMAARCPTTLLTFGETDLKERHGDLRLRVAGKAHYVRGQHSNPISHAILAEVLKADVVHCHQQHVVASSVAAALCRLLRKKAFVSDLGGGGWDISAYVSTDRWYRGHLHISEYSRRVFKHEALPRAHVILGGVDVDKFAPLAGTQRDGTVLFVGRLLPHKGIDTLIQAATAEMKVEVIGRPAHPQYLEALKRLSDGKNVVFRHDCADDDIVDAYRRAVCVVLPSVYRTMYGNESPVPELLGQTLLEGMACGTAAICTDVASMPEIVVDGVTGFIVPPNDPDALRARLQRLLAEPSTVESMGRAARERVTQKFTWSSVVDRCLEAYRG